ncbi:MAG: 2-amino-4-hydroxy-6-hydroxymethyldihydropteridine diphosphokinase [Candidatus Eremiobacteraeota bacterium]|nr:2-amino-4-hydroxy-6-hydroxymethyldihydropteridine diphosphokinase [Candidatus Eremiobacteraeota bacterium]
MALARIGLGANLGDAAATVLRASRRLAMLGEVRAVSSLYRTTPWGERNQPDFINAALLLETALAPMPLLRALQQIEIEFGRAASYRWGPRQLDLDILAYDDLELDEPGLRIPHRHLAERAFALIPLCEIDPSFGPLLAALSPQARAAVRRLSGIEVAAAESSTLMPEHSTEAESSDGLTGRARRLAQAFVETKLVRLKITGADGSFEFRRAATQITASAANASGDDSQAPQRNLDVVASDLVGIFHFSKPAPTEGERLEGDRELAFVEALGIRNPVRSRGAGQIVSMLSRDGDPVEYGQPLFEIDRG